MDIGFVIKILFAIYTYAALSFFQPLGLIDGEVAKVISYGAMASIFIISILCDNNDGIRHRAQFSTPTRWLLFFIGASTLMPSLSYFEQGFIDSVICTIPFFSYGLYLALRKFDIGFDYLFRLTLSVIVLAAITHIINLYTFPEISFGKVAEEYEFDRGGVRLIIQGFHFVILGFFIAASKIKGGGGGMWWLLLILCYAIILASYTRQHIIACTILGAIAIVCRASGFLKRSILAVVIVISAIIIIPEIPIFRNLADITIEQQTTNDAIGKENVRLTAAKYYGWEATESTINRLFGNGVPSYHSKWGTDIKSYADAEHIYAADVGWFGFNYYFGIFAVIAMLTICYKAISSKNRYSDLGRYYFIWLAVTSLINGALLYQYEIVVTVIALSITDYQNEHLGELQQ